MQKASEYFFNKPTDDLAVRASLGWSVLMERGGCFVHFYRHGCEFRTVVSFAGAYLFILVALDFLLSDHHIAFIAVSTGTAKAAPPDWHSSGCVLIRCHHHSSGLPHLTAVSVATNTAAGGAKAIAAGCKTSAGRTKATAANGFARNACGTGCPDLFDGHERLRGVRPFSKITGAGTPRH